MPGSLFARRNCPQAAAMRSHLRLSDYSGSVQATAKPEELDVEVAGHRRHVEGLSSSRPPVRGAAHLRKLLRRELRRVGAADASLYIDGPRGVVRVRFPSQERYLHVPVSEALAQLRTLPNAAGAEAAVDALANV